MRKAPPPPDPEMGLWQGRSVARRFVSPDGMTVLVGRTAEDNDVLSLRLGSPRDFWFHVAGDSGSHVVVRNPENLDRLPRETERFAAALAAGYSKARPGGQGGVGAVQEPDGGAGAGGVGKRTKGHKGLKGLKGPQGPQDSVVEVLF